jgi:polyisoprenoid-binding protein YceI
MITLRHFVRAARVARGARFCQASRMNRTIIAACFAASFGLARIACAEPVVYRFDPVHTQVWFSTEHQKFSHPQGRVRIKDGWFQFDEKDWSQSRVDVEIDLAATDMGDAKWNDTVRSGQLLDVARWPTARYSSRSVEKKDDNTGVIHGDLTFHGTSKPIDVEFTVNRIGNDPYAFKQKAGLSARAMLRRSDFGMKRYADVIGENIEIHIEIEGLADRGAAQKMPGDKPDGA